MNRFPMRRSFGFAAFLAVVAFLFVALLGGSALAYKPPNLEGHLVDTAGKLSASDIRYFDDKLDRFRQRTGYAIVVFITGSLEGEDIDDFTYQTFNAWKVGASGRDDGVLLVIAPNERKVRIETGKGVGGDLTDLRSNDIIRSKITPALKQDRFRDAVEDGTDAIMTSLAGESWETSDGGLARKKVVRPTARGPMSARDWLVLALPFLMPLSLFVILYLVRRRLGRGGPYDDGGWGGGGGGGYYGGGGGGFFGGGGGWGGGGGGGGDWGGGGSGYSGGGGESGGGGSSDSY